MQNISPKVLRLFAILVFCFLAVLTLLFQPFETFSRPSTFDLGHNPSQSEDIVDWSRFAYIQYATNPPYLCNSVMFFEALHRLHSKSERLLMYPSTFSVDDTDDSFESKLLRKARDEYMVNLVPIEVQRRVANDGKSSFPSPLLV
jgi:hypothetical protein